jgi:phage shock protein C
MTQYENGGNWKKGLYRSRNRSLMGVCGGLAEYFDISIGVMRLLWVLAFFFMGGFPVLLAYIVLGLVMKPEPVVPFHSESDREFYDSYTSSRGMAIHRLKRAFDNLNRRIERMETIVTSKDYDWERRFSEGRE